MVNLAAAEGHPAAVMDVSFALQALSVEAAGAPRAGAGPRRAPGPDGIDREVGRLKLAALGVRDRRADRRTGQLPGVLGLSRCGVAPAVRHAAFG